MRFSGSVVLPLFLLSLQHYSQQVSAQLACKTTSDCRKSLSISGQSECVDGLCTNPFSQGCLRTMDHEKGGTSLFEEPRFRQRVCNSDDVAANDFSNCYQPESEFETFQEIRIGSGDWESSIFLSWILQIMLGELLQVPVTIETATPRSDGSASFYDVPNGMVYSAVPYNYDALKRAVELDGDCTKADSSSGNDACAHLLPEVWSGQINAYTDALNEGYIEPPEGNGMVGKFSFMIPRFTAEIDPTLTIWHGLQNRTKMAETFLRPTTWFDYCNDVSATKCTKPDEVAQRYPESSDEEAAYFSPGIYTGHFRATDKNNCTMYPDTCTGHVVDPPCDWDTLTESQMFWNNIALTSDGPVEPNNGYSYFQMLEIWHAANATRSPVFFWWWKPDSLDQLYADTDFALQPVFLPPPTEECERNRVTNTERCSDVAEDRLGQPIGSCDFPAHSLQKVISTSLFTSTYSQPEATRSPAYEFVKRFRVSDLSLTIMLREWIHTKVDTYGIDPRIAVCEWVYDHLEELEARFIPPGYPRVFEKERSKPMAYASFSLGCLALFLVLLALLGTIKHRDNLIFKYAHIPFVLLILAGLMMVVTGAVLLAPQPSDSLCMAQTFLINLGYTIELMPLVVKVSAVNRMIHATKRMRKVRIDTNQLNMQVGGVALCVLIYVSVWAILDAPTVVERAHLLEQGESDVSVLTSCQSSTDVWVMAAYIWQGVLLLSTLILAIQSRNIKQEFNESQSLAFVVYSHTLFLILRALIYSLPAETFSSSNTQSGIISICLSLDSINTLMVYFTPKFYAIATKQDTQTQNSSFNSNESKSEERPNRPSRRSQNAHSEILDEPPPEGDEIQALMGEACDLLVQAAVAHDKEHQESVNLSSSENSLKDNNEDRKKENHFMTKEELVSLRNICMRIGRARFDFENKEEKTDSLDNIDETDESDKEDGDSDANGQKTIEGIASGNSIKDTASFWKPIKEENDTKPTTPAMASGRNSKPRNKAVSWASVELKFSSAYPGSDAENSDNDEDENEEKVNK